MQLDCSGASSGTTSNDITSICDVHHQQCSHLRETAKRHLSRPAVREADFPTEQEGSGKAINLSISWTALRCSGLHLSGTLEQGDGLLRACRIWKELCSWIMSPFWFRTRDRCNESGILNQGFLVITAILEENQLWAKKKGLKITYHTKFLMD